MGLNLDLRDFSHDFLTDDAIILQTYNYPDKIESLKEDMRLYFKVFRERKSTHLTRLLISIQLTEGKLIVQYAHWIPEDIPSEMGLLNMLELFANRFGQKICIGSTCSYFIRSASRMYYGDLNEEIHKCVEIKGDTSIPVSVHLPFDISRKLGIQYVHFFYCFALNHYKYNIWLHQIQTKAISISNRHREHIEDILSELDPMNKTVFNILKSKNYSDKKAIDVQKNETERVDIEVPTIYYDRLTYLTLVMDGLAPDEQIAIHRPQKIDKCVFCANNNLSTEHILPKWTRKFFKEQKAHSQITQGGKGEELLDNLRRSILTKVSSSYGDVVRAVCVTCNNEWMSQLEDSVLRILVVDDQICKSLSHLNLSDRYELSKWLVLKMLLISLKDEVSIVLPDNFYKGFKDGKIPRYILVEYLAIDSYDLTYGYTRGGLNPDSLFRLKVYDKEQAIKLGAHFLMLTLQIGNLAFRISCWDDNSGLKREGFLNKTTILFPENYNLPFFEAEVGDALTNVEPVNQFRFLTLGLHLTDFH